MTKKFSGRHLSYLLAAMLAANPAPLHAHEDEDDDVQTGPPLILGVLDFPNSGAEAAQDDFTRGVMLLHSFEFDDARAAFLAAQEPDPGFAMAIWGEAMTLNHPLWAQQDRDTAHQVLAKLPPKGQRKTTDREEGFLDAIRILYGEGSKQQRDIAYMEAMRELHEAYPDDLEAASFYALSVLGSVYERDFRTYMKAASIAEEVFAKQPQHPGAAHYLIHSYDDQIHAPLGLRAARAYSKIAPAASHAQHMVSHIYTSLGMWDEVVEANRNAVRVSEESMRRSGRETAMRSKHSLHWLQYALLQQGQFGDARDALLIMQEDVSALPNYYNRRHNALMRASYAVEDPLSPRILGPSDQAEFPLDDKAVDLFADTFVLIANGDVDEAQASLARLRRLIDEAVVVSVEEGLHENDSATSEDGYLIATIIARQLEALLLFQGGNQEQAVRLLELAAADENGRPLYYGPPHVPKPSSELLGEMFLALRQPEAAELRFRESLQRNTGRSLSLLGLARAQNELGAIEAEGTWQQLFEQWHGPQQDLRDLPYSWL